MEKLLNVICLTLRRLCVDKAVWLDRVEATRGAKQAKKNGRKCNQYTVTDRTSAEHKAQVVALMPQKSTRMPDYQTSTHFSVPKIIEMAALLRSQWRV